MDKLEKTLQHFKKGKMIVVVDDPERENEGDLVMAAEHITPPDINFMITHARGLVCLAITEDRAKELDLNPMVSENTSHFSTNFTVSIEAAEGVTTGISAYDRAKTIRTAVDPAKGAKDLTRPGHVFPLIADNLGVLGRPGHTEAGVDIAKMAGLRPSAVICEILASNGQRASRDELHQFAKKYNFPIISVGDIIEHRLKHELLITKKAKTNLPTRYGQFEVHAYHDINQREHIALVLEGTDLSTDPVLTRVHSACLTGDVFGSNRCDCQSQLHRSLEIMKEQGGGVVLYLDQEGRGIGLVNKMQAYALQDEGLDTVEANTKLGHNPDERQFWVAAQMLKDLNISAVKLLTNNPVKISQLEHFGIKVERESHWTSNNHHNSHYLKTKKERMGHLQ